MQLLCNGVVLDLMSGATLSFKKINPLFGFDALSCERTQTFDIPGTPNNERVLKLAKVPAFDGTGMRVRYECELQDGVVVKKGYLYVDSYANGTYKGIFVTGELIGLQNIKNLGKISEALKNITDYLQWTQSIPDLPERETQTWAVTKYVQKGEPPHPSMRVSDIVTYMVRTYGLRIALAPSSSNFLRIVSAKPKLLKTTTAKVSRIRNADYSDPLAVYPANIVTLQTVASDQTRIGMLFGTTTVDGEYTRFNAGVRMWTLEGRITHSVANIPLKITFPSDFPSTAYIGKFKGAGYFENAFEFYGDRSFTKIMRNGETIITRNGDPLAGRTIEIERGEMFTIVQESDYLVYEETTTTGTQGWKVNTDLSFDLTIEGAREAEIGDVVRLQDNLPDITLVELLKTIAAVTGTVLNYSDADGVTFDTVNQTEWRTLDLTHSAFEMTDVRRTFGDFAQRNVVNYKSDQTVPEVNRISVAYNIANDNIELERTIQTIPFSEGGYTVISEAQCLTLEAENATDTLALARGAISPYMMRVWLNPNAGMQSLFDASTSITLKARMTLSEYERMDAHTCVLFEGTRYVWTEATWQSEVATLKLSKIL